MKPTSVMAQLCWLYGRDDRFISRLLNWPMHIVHQVCRPVWHLRGVAQ